MKLPEYREKRKRGPALFLTLATGCDPGMGKPPAQRHTDIAIVIVGGSADTFQ
jgi:hypothetical protein